MNALLSSPTATGPSAPGTPPRRTAGRSREEPASGFAPNVVPLPRPAGVIPVMNDDAELLRRYAHDRSEAAFTELVRRTAGLVYSAALRQVGGDTLLAQDVSQSVFIDLAHKAAELVDRPVLASWLYTSTRFAALKALRERRRRTIREQEAHTMQEAERRSPTTADWQELRPLLDSALCNLAEHDRAPILMRYFEGRPFAEMGRQLGIGESSARMRAERALEKLRAALARQGVTSTAAALGLVLSTQAVAAPPAGLAATLAGGALASSTAGGGLGLVAKASNYFAANKLPPGVVAFASVGAAGFATVDAADATGSTTFLVYSICFGVGLLFTLLSAVGAHVFGGHADAGHEFEAGGHDGGGDGGHGQGHAEGGGGASDMPGFAPLSPTTIATFVTAFGGFGMIFAQFEAMRSAWISAPLSALGALAIAAAVFWLFRVIFQKTQASSEGRLADIVGIDATVITPIASGAVGEIAYVQSGTRYSAPARAEDGVAIPNGAAVHVTRVVGTQFYVTLD